MDAYNNPSNEKRRFTIPSIDEMDEATNHPASSFLFNRSYNNLHAFHNNPALAYSPAASRPSRAIPTTLRSFHSNPYFPTSNANHNALPNPTPTLIWPSSSTPVPSSQAGPSNWPSSSTTTRQVTSDEVDEASAAEVESTGKRWEDAETRLLIAVWQDNYHKIGRKRNAAIWKEIAEQLNKKCSENGIRTVRTPAQCKTKIKNLTDDYKKVKDGNKKSGNSRQSFQYYDEMDEILGTRDSTQPKNMVEIGSPLDTPDDEDNQNNEGDDHNDNTAVKSEDSKPKDRSVRDVEKKRAKRKTPSDDIDVVIKYMEESEKREKDFFLRLAEMDSEREEMQQEKSMKMIAEIAKILKN